jgi:YesN/AraC family two-component response regulator
MRHILLVDADRDSHLALARACAAFATVRQARTATQACQLLNEHTIDLVVLEHRLSDSPGLRLLATIKTQQPRLPVIMSTAYGSERVCAAALKLGARDYFIKPWAASEIVGSIQAILATTQRRRERRQNVVGAQAGPAHPLQGGRDGIELAIREAARLIAEHSWDPGSFSLLARDLRLSKSALSRKFKQTLNVSYRRFLQESRVTRARELLRASSFTITEIAQLIGFGDLPRFDKVFKNAVGTSPSRYRQQQTRAPQQPTSQSA